MSEIQQAQLEVLHEAGRRTKVKSRKPPGGDGAAPAEADTRGGA